MPGEVRRAGRDLRRGLVQVRCDDRRGRVAGERRRAREQLEHGAAQGVQVGAVVEDLVVERLGRHVRHGPDGDARRRHADRLARGLGDAEVGELDLRRTVGVEGHEDVGGLDVAVRDVGVPVGVVQARAGTVGDADGEVERHRAPLGEHARRVRPGHVLHGDPQPAVELAAVVQVDDVAVVELREHVGLALEPRLVLRVAADRAVQQLQRVLPG
ncbi:hypothetical protein MTP03_43710 [Tsukamurella sp. PLM1]|nr:hypothetical protein MTP03_43710 [Tsukamurella sp. PLM1]